MPVVVWANGGCLNVGTIMAPFLLQVASQGVVVLATGPKEDPAKGGTFGSYGTYGQVQPKAMSDAIDWAEKIASEPKWSHIDTSRIAAAGQSCGGMLAYTVENDKRVKALGIFNSGNFAKDSQGNSKGGDPAAKGGRLMVYTDVTKFTKPVFYFLGGPKDVAYQNVSAYRYVRQNCGLQS
jgi:dienelactone hydrolase